MARTVRDTNLETRTARSRLNVRHKPYWRKIDQGCHIGYYKGKRAGSWVARYFLGKGKYAEQKLGTADDVQDADGVAILSFAQAQAKARAWFTEQARKSAGLEADGLYTVANVMRDYLSWFAAQRRGLRATTYSVEAHILPALGNVEAEKLTTERIRQWHVGMAASPARLRTGPDKPQKFRPASSAAGKRRSRRATANRVLTILKAALSHAWGDGKVASDEAWRRVKPFRDADAAKVRYFSTDECRRLVNACEPDFRRLVTAALLTGCRYGELTVLRCSDFNPDTQAIFVRTSKSGRSRHVPLNEEGIACFTRDTAGRKGDEVMFLRADGKLWGVSHQRRRLESAAEIAGIDNVSFHMLRHSYGSTLAMEGVPMGVIAHVLGHADTRMTERHYAAFAPSYIADTIRTNLPQLGIVEADSVTPLRQRR